MSDNTTEATSTEYQLHLIKQTLSEMSIFAQAAQVVWFDRMTACPENGVESAENSRHVLESYLEQLRQRPDVVTAVETLYGQADALDPWDRAMTAKLYHELQRDLYDTGAAAGSAQSDALRASCREPLAALLRRIQDSPQKIRTDFLNRTVTESQRLRFAEYVLPLMGFDLARGAVVISDHDMTWTLNRNDVRICLASGSDLPFREIYVFLHECGIALSEQLQPAENYTHFLVRQKNAVMKESIARFYENIIGRSKAFTELIYPAICNIFPQVMFDVTPQELYEGVNYADMRLPVYIRGDFCNAMFANALRADLDLEQAIARGDFASINQWMATHVFAKMTLLPLPEWIRDITGRTLTAEDYLQHLETVYTDLYHLSADTDLHNKRFDDYVKRMSLIRVLSSPQLERLDTAEAYITTLAENFRNIGALAEENRQLISSVIAPILQSAEPLSDETVEQLILLNENLMDAGTHDNIDLPIMALLSDRLMKDALYKNSDAYLIRQADQEIIACIALLVQTRRIISRPQIADAIRHRGLQALDTLLAYLDKDKFAQLDDASKELVLINTRYADGLFVTLTPLSAEDRARRFALIEASLALEEDPFYREALPDYDWKYHRYRAYQYLSSYDEFENAAGNDPAQLARIADYGVKLEQLWLSDEAYFAPIDDFAYIHSHTMRNLLHAGKITREAYCDTLFALYEKRDPKKYDVDAIITNIEIPSEYITALQVGQMTEKQRNRIQKIYHSVISYIFRIPKLGSFYELMDYFAPLVFGFVEVPGGVTFEELVLQAFAAFHPPTYIHSTMVARISCCLASHLIKRDPALFLGICGCTSTEEVQKRADTLLDYTWHAALCHDFGKLIIIDTVFVYGRKILDFEFDIIKEHPALGADLLSKYTSTRDYADVARGHHRWYNGQGGYPDTFDPTQSPVKTIIDIVVCADGMDAATDSVGRSYSRGKSLPDYAREVAQGAGTRYAPYLAELLQQPAVTADLQYLLREGRQDVYRNTYLLLKGVHNTEH